MKSQHALLLIAGTAMLFALWEVLQHQFLMALPIAAQHWISGSVAALLTLTITIVSTRTILRQQRELEKMARLREDLTHMVVHDLRTPLTVMIASLSTLRDGMAEEMTAEARELAGMALDGSESLLHLVNDLLDIARMEAGESNLELAQTDVAALAAETVRTLAPLAAERRINLTCDVAPEMPPLCLDGSKVRRVLMNLLGNALKFTPLDGAVALQVLWEPVSRRLRLTVQDTGEGIPPEDQKRIFDKFGQVENRKAGRKMSSGLGLTFCKLVAEAHGGTIRVQSEPGRGSIFIVELPDGCGPESHRAKAEYRRAGAK